MIEDERDRRHGEGEKRKERHGPCRLVTEVMHHTGREKWESPTNDRAGQGIRCNGAVGETLVHVDEVDYAALKDEDHAAHTECKCDDGWPRGRGLSRTCEGEPEQTYGEESGTEAHRDESLLRVALLQFTLFSQLACIPLHIEDDKSSAEEDTDEDGDEWKGRNKGAHATHLAVDDWQSRH